VIVEEFADSRVKVSDTGTGYGKGSSAEAFRDEEEKVVEEN